MNFDGIDHSNNGPTEASYQFGLLSMFHVTTASALLFATNPLIGWPAAVCMVAATGFLTCRLGTAALLSMIAAVLSVGLPVDGTPNDQAMGEIMVLIEAVAISCFYSRRGNR